MTKRKNRNAQKPADQQPQTGLEQEQEVGGASQAETGVVVGGGSAAAATGEEHQAGTDAPALDDDARTVIDVSENAPDPAAGGASGAAGVQSADRGSDADVDLDIAIDAAEQGDDADGSADPAPGAGSGEVAADAAETDAGLTEAIDDDNQDKTGELDDAVGDTGSSAVGDGILAAADGSAENLPAGDDAGDTGTGLRPQSGDGAAAGGEGDQPQPDAAAAAAAGGAAGTAGIQSGLAGSGGTGASSLFAGMAAPSTDQPNDSDGSADGTTGVVASDGGSGELTNGDEDRETSGRTGPDDAIVNVAEEAAWQVVDYLGELFPLSDEEHASVRAIAGFSDAGSAPTNCMATLIRTIGAERATPAVLGQQLKIDGHVESGELTKAQALVVKIFATIVQELDAFEKDWNAEPIAELEARGRVPIEDTTFEPVDGPMDTWS